MDKEERAKYDCEKDKENLQKHLDGKSSIYISQRHLKSIYGWIAFIALYGLFLAIVSTVMFSSAYNIASHDKDILIGQVDKYIKQDYKNMNCIEKNSFMEKYSTDPTIYYHDTMKSWMQSNFEDNCKMNENKP